MKLGDPFVGGQPHTITRGVNYSIKDLLKYGNVNTRACVIASFSSLKDVSEVSDKKKKKASFLRSSVKGKAIEA